MKQRIALGLIFLVLVTVLTGTAVADLYNFELSEAFNYAEATDNWSIDISVPALSGMADTAAQTNLNAYLLTIKDEMMADYEKNVASAEQSIAEGNEPHFSYQYSYDIVTDTETYFVFRISEFYAFGSSTTLNQYFTLDKNSGKLLNFDQDVVTSSEQLDNVRGQILAQMEALMNAGEGIFFFDDSLDTAMSKISELNHWYFNSDGNLVITFDKYDIGPGVMGCPEFEIAAQPVF